MMNMSVKMTTLVNITNLRLSSAWEMRLTNKYFSNFQWTDMECQLGSVSVSIYDLGVNKMADAANVREPMIGSVVIC
jgi:hypothetical protein